MKFAIIGCGLIGNKRARYLPDLNYACDVNIDAAISLAKKFKNCTATSNLHDVINSDVEVVFVSVSNFSLYPTALSLIQAGKHVLLEKPGAISSEQLESLEKIREKSGSLVRIGYNHRYHRAFLKLRELMKSTNFGEFMFLRARYGHGGRVGYDKEWRANPNFSGGGELIDQGVHLIDLSQIFLENFQSIEGHVDTYFWNMTVDDNAFVNLRNEKGNTAWLHVSCTEWKNTFSLEIYGKNAKFHWEGLGGSYGVEKLTHYQMLPEMGPPETTVYEFPFEDNSWKIEMEEFFDDIKTNRIPIPGLKEGIVTLKTVEKIYDNCKSAVKN